MIIPPKLKKWDEIRVVALARSLSLIWEKNTKLALENFEKQWYKITFGNNVWEIDEFDSSSIESRIQDLHEAFVDNNVKAIFSVVWWFNTNQLLDYVDFQILQQSQMQLQQWLDL